MLVCNFINQLLLNFMNSNTNVVLSKKLWEPAEMAAWGCTEMFYLCDASAMWYTQIPKWDFAMVLLLKFSPQFLWHLFYGVWSIINPNLWVFYLIHQIFLYTRWSWSILCFLLLIYSFPSIPWFCKECKILQCLWCLLYFFVFFHELLSWIEIVP